MPGKSTEKSAENSPNNKFVRSKLNILKKGNDFHNGKENKQDSNNKFQWRNGKDSAAQKIFIKRL